MNFGFGFDEFEGPPPRGGGGRGGGRRGTGGGGGAQPDTKYYDLLGVGKDASQDDITKAYRTLARKLHPDRNPDPEAKERFQELTHAYQVLTDPKKKEIYDKHGEEGLKQGGDPFANPHDIFSHFFGGGGMREESHGQQQAEDIGFRCPVTLRELYNGKNTKVKIDRRVLCSTCDGKGCNAKGSVEKCTACNGRGIRVIIQRIGPMITQSQAICDVCRGQKVVIAEKDRCVDCRGKKIQKKEKVLEVHIIPGSKWGEVQNFYGEGEHLPDMHPGDVKIQITEKEEDDTHYSKFKRQGDDLVFEHTITLLEALTGFVFHLRHFDERILIVSSEPGDVIKPGDVKVIEGEGMPKKGNAFSRGNLFLKFDVAFPKPGTVDEKTKNALLSILEKPMPPPKLEGEEIHYEEVVAKSIDSGAYADADGEEEEEEEGEGRRRVECMNNIM